jgi:hypothetical protein
MGNSMLCGRCCGLLGFRLLAAYLTDKNETFPAGYKFLQETVLRQMSPNQSINLTGNSRVLKSVSLSAGRLFHR